MVWLSIFSILPFEWFIKAPNNIFIWSFLHHVDGTIIADLAVTVKHIILLHIPRIQSIKQPMFHFV